jgi:hypothetical protein
MDDYFKKNKKRQIDVMTPGNYWIKMKKLKRYKNLIGDPFSKKRW